MPLPFIKPTQLEEIADRFLREHHPSCELPVPIEEIVEFSLGMNIVPVERLYKDFGIDGWISNALSTIFVDAVQLADYETRYRFTLAHEVAHRLLHADLYQGAAFRDVEEWLTWRESMDEKLIEDYEWQGRNLAGRILVPTGPLVEKAGAALKEREDRLPPGVDPRLLWQYVAIPLARVFNVHESVVFYRLDGDRVGEKLRPDTGTRPAV